MPIAVSSSGLADARRGPLDPPVMLAEKLMPKSSPLAILNSLGASSSARGRSAISRNLGFECREYVVHVDAE